VLFSLTPLIKADKAISLRDHCEDHAELAGPSNCCAEKHTRQMFAVCWDLNQSFAQSTLVPWQCCRRRLKPHSYHGAVLASLHNDLQMTSLSIETVLQTKWHKRLAEERSRKAMHASQAVRIQTGLTMATGKHAGQHGGFFLRNWQTMPKLLRKSSKVTLVHRCHTELIRAPVTCAQPPKGPQ